MRRRRPGLGTSTPGQEQCQGGARHHDAAIARASSSCRGRRRRSLDPARVLLRESVADSGCRRGSPAHPETRIRLKCAEALPGCADATIQIRKVNESEMTGTRWGKTELKSTRE